MRNWTELGLRQVGTMSARSRVTVVPEIFAERVAELMALADTELAVPVRGITADGQVEPGLYGPGKPVDTSGIRRAALAFADSLPAAAREKLFLPFDSPHWRTWINVHMDFFRHGVMLDGLDAGQRELGLALVREALSTRGYEQLRGVMRLNEFLAVLGGSTEEFGEWLYNLTIFGDPAVGDQVPWGFQLDGHHLAVNCVVAGDDISVAPVFMGSEPCVVTADDAARLRPGQFRTTDIGRFTGMEVFRLEEAAGEDLIGTLDAAQRQEAVAYPSLMPDTLPEHYQHWYNGRVQAGPFRDNLVLPYQGLRADAMTDRQRALLLQVIAVYLGWARDDHGAAWMETAREHLDGTWFTWFGGTEPGRPFYYRVHSPVVLIEFDHHKGVVFDNAVPDRNHIHSVVRAPNGGDYGIDLLARHYARAGHHAGAGA